MTEDPLYHMTYNGRRINPRNWRSLGFEARYPSPATLPYDHPDRADLMKKYPFSRCRWCGRGFKSNHGSQSHIDRCKEGPAFNPDAYTLPPEEEAQGDA